ncbi:MAG: NADH-quinone oxidoreductase subunit J family protein [Anaerolineaceae bacterium]
MTGMQILFLITAAVVLFSSIMSVTARRMIHSALWFVLALLGVAVVFALLEASFFAVVQVLIYVGAIAILIIFGTMLTRRALEDQGKQFNGATLVTLVIVSVIFAGLVVSLKSWVPLQGMTTPLSADQLNVGSLGLALTAPDGFALPFEVTSILLLAALIGAIYVAYERKEKKK